MFLSVGHEKNVLFQNWWRIPLNVVRWAHTMINTLVEAIYKIAQFTTKPQNILLLMYLIFLMIILDHQFNSTHISIFLKKYVSMETSTNINYISNYQINISIASCITEKHTIPTLGSQLRIIISTFNYFYLVLPFSAPPISITTHFLH